MTRTYVCVCVCVCMDNYIPGKYIIIVLCLISMNHQKRILYKMNMQSDKGSQQQTNSNEIVTTEHQKKKHNKIYISGAKTQENICRNTG